MNPYKNAMINASVSLEIAIERARDREDADDHLSDADRAALVRAWRNLNLPAYGKYIEAGLNDSDIYVEIVCN